MTPSAMGRRLMSTITTRRDVLDGRTPGLCCKSRRGCGVGFSTSPGVFLRYPPIVVCGPSGSGKSTLIRALMNRQPWRFSLSVSHTTRSPRPGETDGVHYYFVEHQEMWQGIERGDFLEYANFAGHLYGTSKRALLDCSTKGRICLLDLDIQGVQQLKKRHEFVLRYVFVKPPSMDDLERRLRSRGTDSEASIQKRMARAGLEMEFGECPGNFDAVVVNDDLNESVVKLLTVVDEFCAGEEHKREHRGSIIAESDGLI